MPNPSLQELISVGNILHFDKFDFEDGLDKKGRFGIILGNENGILTLATTSASFIVPDSVLTQHSVDKGDLDCITMMQKELSALDTSTIRQLMKLDFVFRRPALLIYIIAHLFS